MGAASRVSPASGEPLEELPNWPSKRSPFVPLSSCWTLGAGDSPRRLGGTKLADLSHLTPWRRRRLGFLQDVCLS